MAQPPKNYCPFHCPMVDEIGHCHHLVGFTNDGKRVELLERVKDLRGGEPTPGGVPRMGGTRKVQAGDTLVNPEADQFDKMTGLTHKAKLWVSARVYRADATAPPNTDPEESAEPEAAPKERKPCR